MNKSLFSFSSELAELDAKANSISRETKTFKKEKRNQASVSNCEGNQQNTLEVRKLDEMQGTKTQHYILFEVFPFSEESTFRMITSWASF